MKNKKLMYVLLITSVLVWGWVFVKIFHVVFEGEDAPAVAVKKKNKAESIQKKDTFQLLLAYKDPFLKTRHREPSFSQTNRTAGLSVSRPVQVNKKENPKPVKEEKVIDWNFIHYKGRITRQSTGKMLSLLTIGGGDFSLEEGKEIQGVFLVKSYPDSILVRFDGVKQYIKRNRN